MVKVGKRRSASMEKFEEFHKSKGKDLSLSDAIDWLKKDASEKFDETINVDVNLGIDAQKGDQVVRGSVVLPHGTGRKSIVLVFAKGEHAQAAADSGADFVGFEDLVEKIEGGWLDFDFAVATPDLMGRVGRLAKVLGPRGLLPNKKSGTVTFDVGQVVSSLKKGMVFFRNDKYGIVHQAVGKASFEADNLRENLIAFIKALASTRPPTVKGVFLKKVTVSSTMGLGIPVRVDEIL